MTETILVNIPYGNVITFHYINYRGEPSLREVASMGIFYGHSKWHPEDQFILKGFDRLKKEVRYFAIKDISNLKLSMEEMSLTDMITTTEVHYEN